MANPVLVQHTVTPNTIGLVNVSSLNVSLPNPSLAGNLIICAVQFNAGSYEPTCADDHSQSYTGIMYAGGGGQSCKLFYFLNSAAGVKKITITWGGTIGWVQAMAAEFYNVATTSADVTSTPGTGTSTSWQATGTIAGNATSELPYLVYQVGFSNVQTAQSSFAARAGFELGCALLPGNTDHGSVSASSQWGVVTSSLTNPIITAGTSRGYTTIAVAFKSAAAGTAPTLTPRVCRTQFNEFDAASPVALQFPNHGGVIVGSIISNVNAAKILVTGITDNHNTWDEIEGSPIDFGGAGRQQMFYAENAVADDATMISLAYTGSIVGNMIALHEIVGATTYNNAAVTSGTKDTTGNLTSVTITPAASGHLIICHCDHTEGTEMGCVADTNGHLPNFETPYWGSENGDAISFFCHDSGQANFLTTETSDVTFIWSRSATAPGDWVALAAAFRSGTAALTANPEVDTLNGGKVRFG